MNEQQRIQEYKKLNEFTDQQFDRQMVEKTKTNKVVSSNNQLPTDEDAEVKRAVLQLSYINDL